MNSVFSAFKSNSSSGSSGSSGGGGGIGTTSDNSGGSVTVSTGSKSENKQKFATKKITQDSCSYENLKHIREIGSSAKMSNYVASEVNDLTLSLVSKRCITPLSSPITEHCANMDYSKDNIDCVIMSSPNCAYNIGECNKTNICSSTNNTSTSECKPATKLKPISASESNLCDQKVVTHAKCSSGDIESKSSPLKIFSISSNVPKLIFSSEGDILSSCGKEVKKNSVHRSENDITLLNDHKPNVDSINITSKKQTPTNEVQAPIIMASVNTRASDSNLSSSANKINRFQKRLNLSGFSNNSMPSVHGRQLLARNGNGSETKKTRLSTHQRNLSLDFR